MPDQPGTQESTPGRLMNIVQRLISEISAGGPLSRLWIYHVGLGALGCGIFSIPSSGIAVVLVPFFFMSAVCLFWGSIPRYKDEKTVCVGLGLLTVCAWARAIALWGLDQHGWGGNVIASFVWAWIAGACIMLFISTWNRGIV